MILRRTIFILFLGVICYGNNLLSDGIGDIVNEMEKIEHEKDNMLAHIFKQRIRTQLISRDILLVAINYKKEHYKEELSKNAEEFNHHINGKKGNHKKQIGKILKKNPHFITHIKKTRKLWSEYYKNLKKFIKDDRDKEALNFLLKHNKQLLQDTDNIFTNFVDVYLYDDDELEASIALIKITLYSKIGKPRTYVNMVVKDRLLIEMGYDKESTRKNMQKDIKTMDELMHAIKSGDKKLGIYGTEDKVILKKLSVSQKIWEDIKSIVQKETLSLDEIGHLIEKNDEFIETYNEVVKLTRASTEV